MARRKKIFTKTTTNKSEFLETLEGALVNYAPRCHDIETYTHEVMGVQLYTIDVYRL